MFIGGLLKHGFEDFVNNLNLVILLQIVDNLVILLQIVHSDEFMFK